MSLDYPGFKTRKQVAALIGISDRTLMRDQQRGYLHGYNVGGRWRYTAQQINDYLTAKTAAAQAGKT